MVAVREFTVRMRGVTVGWSELAGLDNGMGAASGPFRPGPGYELVQPVFRLFVEAEGVTPTQPADDAKLARYYAARDQFGLTLHGPDGAAIPVEFIHIADYSVEAGQGALELQVAAASRSAWRAIAGMGADAPEA